MLVLVKDIAVLLLSGRMKCSILRQTHCEIPSIDDAAERIVKRSQKSYCLYECVAQWLLIRWSKLGFGNPNGASPVGCVV